MSAKQNKFRIAFTIVELLIGLAITAVLMVAVAVAFTASVKNYTENEEIYKTINNARQALFRMTSQLRTADPNHVGPCLPNTECTLVTSSSENITYRFVANDKKLYLITNGNSYVLCDNVADVTFTKLTAPAGSIAVQISITLNAGDMTRTLSAAVVVRRSLS